MLHPDFDLFTSQTFELIPVPFTVGSVMFCSVEGMVMFEFDTGFFSDEPAALKDMIFKAINHLVPIWQPRLFASDQRMQQADVCATIVNKIGAPTITAASVVITPYQDDDCPARTEVLIKLVKQADGIHRLTVITL